MVGIDKENTGSRVAEEIEKLGIKVPTIIHSYNPYGVKYMMSKIKHANALPFRTFTIDIVKE